MEGWMSPLRGHLLHRERYRSSAKLDSQSKNKINFTIPQNLKICKLEFTKDTKDILDIFPILNPSAEME